MKRRFRITARYRGILFLLFFIAGIFLFPGKIYAKESFHGQKYQYNESNQSQVTVAVTISSDGIPNTSKVWLATSFWPPMAAVKVVMVFVARS